MERECREGKNMIYTKNGKPLQIKNDRVYSKGGVYIGIIRNEKVFAPTGKYVGTIMSDRLVFLSTHSSSLGPQNISSHIVPFTHINAVPSAIYGDEPNTPD